MIFRDSALVLAAALALPAGVTLAEPAGPAGAAPQDTEPLEQEWREVEITSPDARNRHAVEYDPRLERVMLFGGNDGGDFPGSLRNDTWLWDGEDWFESLNDMHPPPPSRRKHAMAYHASLSSMVMFGGIVGPASESSETWEWRSSDERWQFKMSGGPAARRGHAMAYHPEADYPGAIGPGLVVLFGGRAVGESEAFDDMWVYDGKEWVEVTESAPPGRYLHQMVYDEDREVVVLFGGTEIGASGDPFGDTWEWDGESWELVSTSGPSPRFRHSMAYDAARGVTVLYGGQPVNNETWEWDGNTWQQSPADPPDTPMLAGLTYDPERERVVLFGGQTAAVRGETWEYDGTSWELKASAPPPPRTRPAVAYDAARGNVLMFGGNDGDSRLNDTWTWDGEFWRQRFSQQIPPARDNAGVAYNEATERVMIYGGDDEDDELGDTWVWDGEQWEELTGGTSPPTLAGVRMAYDPGNQEVILFGGYDGSQHSDRTWIWGDGSWEERVTPGPVRRNTHAMARHDASGQIVMFGGFLGGLSFAFDTYEWDGQSWEFATSGEPDGRADHAMAYDSLREEIVLYGGFSIVGMSPQWFNDWWKWDGEEWTEAGPGLRPSARSGHGMAYDSFHDQVVLFGGNDGQPLNETWLYGPDYEIPPGARAVGDFDNDGCTGFPDFVFLLENWGEVIDGQPLGFPDFVALLENWGC